MRGKFLLLPLVLFAAGFSCAPSHAFELTSEAFGSGDTIPLEYTLNGGNASPPLAWSGAPEGTKSFALVADDPDAPAGTWVHWVMYDIPGEASSLGAELGKGKVLADGAKQGVNSFGKTGYDGPSPPPGPAHRYVFTLYALDAKLGLPPGAAKEALLKRMQGHILATAELVGMFGR